MAAAAVAILLGIASWRIGVYLDDQDDPPLVLAPSTTSSTEAEHASRVLVDQAVVINVDELEECRLSLQTVPNVDLPEWAHAARLIAGRWLLVHGAIALPSIDPERPQFSILWHLETPPSDPTDFTATATTPSGEEVEAIDLQQTAPGFFRSTFALQEPGCWLVRAEWKETETQLRFLTNLYSAH